MRMLALLTLALLGLSPADAWAQSIKMGAVVPLTGRYGAGGAQIRAGYEFAVERLNAGGGITVGGVKMPVELILLDDESDATKTVARMETLAAQGGNREAAARSLEITSRTLRDKLKKWGHSGSD